MDRDNGPSTVRHRIAFEIRQPANHLQNPSRVLCCCCCWGQGVFLPRTHIISGLVSGGQRRSPVSLDMVVDDDDDDVEY